MPSHFNDFVLFCFGRNPLPPPQTPYPHLPPPAATLCVFTMLDDLTGFSLAGYHTRSGMFIPLWSYKATSLRHFCERTRLSVTVLWLPMSVCFSLAAHILVIARAWHLTSSSVALVWHLTPLLVIAPVWHLTPLSVIASVWHLTPLSVISSVCHLTPLSVISSVWHLTPLSVIVPVCYLTHLSVIASV